MEKNKLIQKIQKSCAVCKFSIPDPQLDDELQIICSVDPNNPVTKSSEDTCLKHRLRYKNLKIIVEDEHLMEYDTKNQPIPKSNTIADAKTIGANEWQS